MILSIGIVRASDDSCNNATRGCGCDGSVSALRNRRLAVAASRKPESTKLIVAPVEARCASRIPNSLAESRIEATLHGA